MNRTALTQAMERVSGATDIVVPKAGGNADFVVKEGGLFFRPSGMEEYKVGVEAAKQAMIHVPGLSAAAMKEWPIDLLLEPLNWWYRHGEGDVRALAMNDEILTFTRKTNLPIVNPMEIVEAVESGLVEKGLDAEEFYYDKVRVGLDHCSFAVVTSEYAQPVKVGDIVNGGVMAFASPTGAKATEVSPFLNRLVCTNGMISPLLMERFSWKGEAGNIFDWTKAETMRSYDAIDQEVEALVELTRIEVPDSALHTVLADLFDRHHVNASVRQMVTEAAIIEADGTMFGLAQAFNRAANDGGLNIDQMRHLLMVTGDVAHQTDRCTSCLRAMN